MLPTSIQELAQQLRNFNGIGLRGSQKLALEVLELSQDKFDSLNKAMHQVRTQVVFCSNCGFFAEVGAPSGLCTICQDNNRHDSQVCLVEKATDVISLERSQIYRGRYHVLRNLISPLDNIFPENTTVHDLVQRRLPEAIAKNLKVEIILFFKAGFAADATTAYLRDVLQAKKMNQTVNVTRLAQGLPLYFNPDTLDQSTLVKALEDRRPI